ncbi:hypothetical protein HNY73_017907 [Argiope bruennichi]|uniref:SOCS box domain-containing protein n=1 Tax=Argiope bruennichi TaxID=94029 RepID=A0A8T0EEF5_ARGBR|nr:hypothetical protein HNY73_017907 [Argiope bruennichi]
MAALKTDSSRNSEVRNETKGFTRNHALRRKSVCPSLHLELRSKYTYRVLLYTDMCSHCLERDDKSVYVDRFYVDEIWYKRTFQRRRNLIRGLLHFHEISLQNPEITGYHQLLHLAGEALTLLWRSIPDVLLSKNEIESFSRKRFCRSILSVEKFLRSYEKIVGVIPSTTTPRSLTHYSRLIIRKAMALNLQLPDGISKLDIPLNLKSFLNLEC